MELEERRTRRLALPLLVTLLLAVSLAIPGYLWLTRGRDLPLRVLLDPPRYVVVAGQRVPLRLRLTPADRDRVELVWEGPGLDRQRESWTAPSRPGSYTVKVTARRSGTKARDSVTFLVAAAAPRLERPAAEPAPPRDLPPCEGKRPAVRLHGAPCTGGTVVIEVAAGGSARAWHWLDAGRPQSGMWAELVAPLSGTLTTLVVPEGGACAWTLRRPLGGGECVAGLLQGAVFADFRWELVSPGQVRLAAKPSRTAGVRFERYRWDFGDGTRKETRGPQVSHRFKPPLKRWNLVTLEVVAGDRTAKGLRLVVDRTVQ